MATVAPEFRRNSERSTEIGAEVATEVARVAQSSVGTLRYHERQTPAQKGDALGAH